MTELNRHFSEEIYGKAAKVKLLALDVDGVMTDGKLLFSAQGDELKAFNISGWARNQDADEPEYRGRHHHWPQLSP